MGGQARRLAVMVGVVAALAGCAETAPSIEGPAADANGTTEPGRTTGEAEAPTTPAPAAPHRHDLYFTADGGLVGELPDPAAVPVPQGWAGGSEGVPTNAYVGAPRADSFVIEAEEVRARIWLQADAPVASSGAFDVAVWVGSTVGLPLFAFTTFPSPTLAAGTPTLVELTLSFKEMRGLAVPAGEAVRALVTSGAVHDGANLKLLVGGEHASGITVTARNVTFAQPAEVTESEATGSVSNYSLTDCDRAEGVTTQTHPVELSANATWVEIRLAPTSPPASQTDLDIVLLDGGTVLTRTASPYAEEGILLAGPTATGLAGKTLTLRVYGCTSLAVDYRATIVHG